MSEHRPKRSYETIDEIVAALQPGKIGNDQIYVGKQYTKANLINDLLAIKERLALPE